MPSGMYAKTVREVEEKKGEKIFEWVQGPKKIREKIGLRWYSRVGSSLTIGVKFHERVPKGELVVIVHLLEQRQRRRGEQGRAFDSKVRGPSGRNNENKDDNHADKGR